MCVAVGLAGLGLGLLVGLVLGRAVGPADDPGARPPTALQASLPEGRPTDARGEVARRSRLRTLTALEVLRVWDARRASAYASGDAAALRRLYVPGVAARAADLRVLGGYVARGLVVQGLTMQLVSAELVGARRGELTLRVEGRVAAGTVVAESGAGRRTPLPHDRLDTHTVTLERGRGGSWRVSKVLSGARPRAGP